MTVTNRELFNPKRGKEEESGVPDRCLCGKGVDEKLSPHRQKANGVTPRRLRKKVWCPIPELLAKALKAGNVGVL